MFNYEYKKRTKDVVALKKLDTTIKGKKTISHSDARVSIEKCCKANGLDKEFKLLDKTVEMFGYKNIKIKVNPTPPLTSEDAKVNV